MKERTNLRERLLEGWGGWAARNWGKSLLLGSFITLIMTAGVFILSLEMTFFSIMPGSSSQVRDLKKIMADFPLASGITVVVDGREITDASEAEARVKAAVDALEQEFRTEKFAPWVSRVNGRMDREFFRTHGLILSEAKDIRRFTDLYRDLNLTPLLAHLNDDFEREYAGQDDNLADQEVTALSLFRGLEGLINLIAEAAGGSPVENPAIDEVLDTYLMGDPYFLSRDNRMALVIIQPTFTMEDLGPMVKGVTALEETAKQIAREHGITAGLTGLTVVGRDEMVTSEQGLAGSMLIAIILILIIMILAFRMFSVPWISGVPLIIGIYWAVGLTGFTIQRLNIMTAMYMVALVGLGIDYAIHLLTTYVQERDSGANFYQAVEASFRISGPGIITGALTTAAAFFSLMAARTEMMRELGIVAGLGILGEVAAMLIFIPALLGFHHHRRLKKGKEEHRIFQKIKIRTDLASGAGRIIARKPAATALVLLLFCGILTTGAGRVEIEQNLMNMEAEGLESVELQDTLVEEFALAPDGLFILASDLREVKALEKELKDLQSVKRVESAAPFLLLPEEERARREEIFRFRKTVAPLTPASRVDPEDLTEELYRLQMNLLELSDMAYLGGMEKMFLTLNRITGWNEEGDKETQTSLDGLIESLERDPLTADRLALLQGRIFPLLQEKLMRLASAESVVPEKLPSLYGASYISPVTGEFLMSVVPTRNPWEGDFRRVFTTQVESVTSGGTGMILASDQLNTMAKTDGAVTALVALMVIFIILLVDFRNLKLALLTMVPLAASFGALFGFMGYAGIRFDFINIIAIPLLIGIGIDDAVHISHRYRREGPGQMEKTIARTGSAVLLTSLTTIIAFASFIPSVMRAMRSTGVVLSAAIALAFIFSILLHPALLMLSVENKGWNIQAWKRRKK